MTDLLKQLADDWHNPNPYLKLIQSVLPSCKYELQVQNALLKVYEDEHYEFRSLKGNRKIETIYDSEIEFLEFRMKQLEQEREKEDQHFKTLLEKFQKMEMSETPLNEEGEEEDDDDDNEKEAEDLQANQKKKGVQKGCKRTLKAEELRKIQQTKGIKSSMASSQQKMIDLRDESDALEKKSQYYKHYQHASRYYICDYRKALREYSQTKDLLVLIKSLSDVISYYELLMRRNVPKEPCCGEEKSFCKVHLLPLSRAFNPMSNLWDTVKCQASPM
jgi:hypothetical protein